MTLSATSGAFRRFARDVTCSFPRVAFRTFTAHATGSKALDVLTGGGYSASSIIEIQGPNLQTCWELAWLAAAAAYERGWRITACSGTACLDFGAERGLTEWNRLARTSLAEPRALLDVMRCMERDCSLLLVDSWARIAEAATPAGPDPAVTRTLRNRRLRTFLQQLSYRLLQAPARMPDVVTSVAADGAEGSEDGSSRRSDGSRHQAAVRPAPSVIVCNTGQSGHDWVLQQFAALRLRVWDELEAWDGEVAGAPYIAVELLKGPATNTRMPVPTTRVYVRAGHGADAPSGASTDAAHAVMDLLMAAQQLGLVVLDAATARPPGVGDADRPGGEPIGAEVGPASVGSGDAVGFRYGGLQAETLPGLARKLVALQLVPQLRYQVDEELQALSSPRGRPDQ